MKQATQTQENMRNNNVRVLPDNLKTKFIRAKTIKTTIAVLSIITAVFFSSCKEAQLMTATITKVDGVKISGIGLTGVKGKVKVKITNPTCADVTIFKSEMDVKINDIPVGTAKIKRRIVIPAHSEVEQELTFKPGYSKMGLSDIPKVVKTINEKTFKLSVKGNLKEGKRFDKKEVYVNVENNINMKEEVKKVTDVLSMFRKKKTSN